MLDTVRRPKCIPLQLQKFACAGKKSLNERGAGLGVRAAAAFDPPPPSRRPVRTCLKRAHSVGMLTAGRRAKASVSARALKWISADFASDRFDALLRSQKAGVALRTPRPHHVDADRNAAIGTSKEQLVADSHGAALAPRVAVTPPGGGPVLATRNSPPSPFFLESIIFVVLTEFAVLDPIWR